METNKVEPIIIKGNIKLILTELKVNVLCPGTLLGEDEEFSLICRMYEKSTGIKEFEKTKADNTSFYNLWEYFRDISA